MPTLSSVRNINGSPAYIYDLTNEDITSIVTQMSANADAPIAFLGRMNGITEPIDELVHVETLLSAGGQVAANTSSGGTPVNLQFSGNQMVIIPGDGEQSTADMFAGAGDFAYVDDDDFDPFASASDDFPVPDPRGRSQQLSDRYGDDEDDYYDESDYATSSTPAGTGDVVKVSEWLLTLIVLMIPVVNIVMLIVWLVSKKTNPSKKNYLKVQIIFMVFGILLSAFTVVAALQMGVVGALMGDTQQSAQIENTNSNTNANLERRSDNANANANSNSNLNENSNSNASNISSNEGPADSVPTNPSALGELSQETSGILAVDTVQRGIGPDNRSVAVVTLTMNNTTPADASASALIDITGNQGQNALEPNFTPMDGFNPDTFNMPIRPGESGTFQICYFLVDDQDLKIKASLKANHEVILDATQMLH